MTTKEAREIGANPANYPDKLKLARLKLGNMALRAYPASPRQHEIRNLINQIEAMPRDLWVYP